MRSEELFEILGGLDEAAVARAARPPVRARWMAIGAAACLTLALGALLFGGRGGTGGKLPSGPETPPALVQAERPEAERTPEKRPVQKPAEAEKPVEAERTEKTVRVRLGEIRLNELGPSADAARLWRDPALYDEVIWGAEEIEAYFGGNPAPPYVPEGLKAAPGNGTARVMVKKADGSIAEDTIYLRYWHDYDEDGSPKLTEGVAARKGFSLTASKLGILNCGVVYIRPEDEQRVSTINGVDVTFGSREMPYGPYDPETHEPSGYYQLYTAEFTLRGAEYQLVAEQMPLEEVVRVTASLLCGGAAVEIVP